MTDIIHPTFRERLRLGLRKVGRFFKNDTVRLGLTFLFLAAAVIGSTAYGTHRDNASRTQFKECITDQVHRLTDSLTARAKQTDPASDSVRTLIADLRAAKTPKQSQAALDRYDATNKAIAKIRRENPIPPFPDGKCAR